jgi:hypothetical protein
MEVTELRGLREGCSRLDWTTCLPDAPSELRGCGRCVHHLRRLRASTVSNGEGSGVAAHQSFVQVPCRTPA